MFVMRSRNTAETMYFSLEIHIEYLQIWPRNECEVLGCQGYTGISGIWVVVVTLKVPLELSSWGLNRNWEPLGFSDLWHGAIWSHQTCRQFASLQVAGLFLVTKRCYLQSWKKPSRHTHLVVCWESLFLCHLLVQESSQENEEHLPESWWQNQAASSLHSWWHGRELLSLIDFHWDRSPKIRVSPQWRCIVSIQNQRHLWWFQDQ